MNTTRQQRKYVYPSLFFLLLFLLMLLRASVAGAEEGKRAALPPTGDEVAARLEPWAKELGFMANGVKRHSAEDLVQAADDFNGSAKEPPATATASRKNAGKVQETSSILALRPGPDSDMLSMNGIGGRGEKTWSDSRTDENITLSDSGMRMRGERLARQEERVRDLARSLSQKSMTYSDSPLARQNGATRNEDATPLDQKYESELALLNSERNRELAEYMGKRREVLSEMAATGRQSSDYGKLNHMLESLDAMHIAREYHFSKRYGDLDRDFSMRTR